MAGQYADSSGKPSCAPQAACETQDRPSNQIKIKSPPYPTLPPPPVIPLVGPNLRHHKARVQAVGCPQLEVREHRAGVCPPPPHDRATETNPLRPPPSTHLPAPSRSGGLKKFRVAPLRRRLCIPKAPPAPPPPRPCAPFSGLPLAETQQSAEEEACPVLRWTRHQRGGGVADEPPRRRAPPARLRTGCLGMRCRHWRDPSWRGYESRPSHLPPPLPEHPKHRGRGLDQAPLPRRHCAGAMAPTPPPPPPYYLRGRAGRARLAAGWFGVWRANKGRYRTPHVGHQHPDPRG